jgi:VWFA-related protein
MSRGTSTSRSRSRVAEPPAGRPLTVLLAMLAPLALLGAPAHAAAAAAAASAARAQPQPVPQFGEAISVRLVTLTARVVDRAGTPIPGLQPGDFRVLVGGYEVPLAAVDWIANGNAVGPAGAPGSPAQAAAVPSATLPAAAPASAAAGSPPSPSPSPSPSPAAAAAASVAPPAPPGKLVVVFVQADANSTRRVGGHLWTLQFMPELLGSLQPEDLVAVVSFSSHLNLWLDFTRDREAVPRAIYQGILYGANPPAPEADAGAPQADAGAPEADAGGLSLARHFDFRAAFDAPSLQRGLEVTAEALAALPGEKVMIMLAWGVPSLYPISGTEVKPLYAAAVQALAAARASVFVLDVTQADIHTLAGGLVDLAYATGGTYDTTFRLPALAIRQLARTISGYYVLSLDAASLPKSGGGVEVELRARRGKVLLRPTTIPASR